MKLRMPRRQLFVATVVMGVLFIGFIGVRLFQPAGHVTQRQGKAVYYCPMHPGYTSDRPGDCPICYMKLVKRDTGPTESPAQSKPKEKKILYWTDPMIPGYKSDKPGKSPMGMDLVPVYEEGETGAGGEGAPSGYASVQITPQKQQLIGIKTAPVEKRRVVKTIRTVGRVLVDETRRVHVHPKVEGWIEEIYAKYEGDKVKRGEPLFSFYSPDFITVQQEYLVVRRMLQELTPDARPEIRAAAEANLNAAQQRILWWDVSKEQIQDLEKRGTPQKTLLLTSPIDGIVLTKHVFPGEYMQRGADFYHLADLSVVWVDAQLYEYDLPLVAIGQEASVTLPNDPDRRLKGKIFYLSPVLNPATRTATARLEFPNPEGALRPEMYTAVEIAVDLGERLVVPMQAILDTGTRRILFVDKGAGLLEPREVIVGARADDAVEIKRGVAEGEIVVVRGNFLIDSESRLKASLEGMAPASDAGVPPSAGAELKEQGQHPHGH